MFLHLMPYNNVKILKHKNQPLNRQLSKAPGMS